ncbi:MAG: efflux RND transporter periplasmic adaptor subunit [Rikenellaceae bacterium]
MNRFRTIALFFAIGVATLLQSCGGGSAEGQKKKAKTAFKTMTVALSNSDVSSHYSASIRGEQFVEIRPQVSGVITDISVSEGAAVKKGQTLFIIDQVPYRAALATAIANVESAKASVSIAALNEKSQKMLFGESVISEVEYQQTYNQLLEANAKLAQAEAQKLKASNELSYTVVKSPVDGEAGMINYRIGSLVSSNITSPLVSVSSNKTMQVYFSIPESQKLSLIRKYGSKEEVLKSMPEVTLQLNDGSTYEHKGRIDAISGIVDRATGSVGLRATFENPELMLSDGGNGLVVLTTQRKDVIVIPKVATFELQDKVFVYKVVDGKATSQQIKVFAQNDGKEYIVESGIDVGDVIIADGAGLVKEGATVTTKSKK